MKMNILPSARSRLAFILGALALAAFALPIAAQQFSINWHKVSGGGGTSTSAHFALSGTAGQQDAGNTMSSANYSLTGGFWALISVTQTPGAPTLFISHSGTTVTVYWQDILGWILQQNPTLGSTNWTDSSGITTAGGTNYLNITSPSGNLFFRLEKP
jgi:hypothetical protein